MIKSLCEFMEVLYNMTNEAIRNAIYAFAVNNPCFKIIQEFLCYRYKLRFLIEDSNFIGWLGK